MNGTGRVAVLGGGVIGVMTAYELARRELPVTLVEAKTLGSGASHGNCGLVSPSHVLPLTMPGMVRQGLSYLFAKNAPLKIRWRLDPALATWLLRFAGRCTEPAMHEAGRARLALLVQSFKLYEEWLSREGLACDWEHRGTLVVYQSETEFERFGPLNDVMAKEYDFPAERVDGAGLPTFEPALKEGLAGGWFYPQDAHLRPDLLIRAMRGVLERRGVEIVEHSPVKELRVERGRVTAAICADRDVTADRFVVATGAKAPAWQRPLGCIMPVQPGKGYSLTMSRPGTCPKLPLLFHDHRVVATPWASGYRLGSLMEFAGFDDAVDADRVALLRDGAAIYLKEPFGEETVETWTGFRPMCADEKPIIDVAPGAANVVVATGHGMLGLSLATGTAVLVADLLTGRTPAVDPSPYRITRFGRRSA